MLGRIPEGNLILKKFAALMGSRGPSCCAPSISSAVDGGQPRHRKRAMPCPWQHALCNMQSERQRTRPSLSRAGHDAAPALMRFLRQWMHTVR